MQSARQQAPTPALTVAAAPIAARRGTPDMQRLAWISGAQVNDRVTRAGQAMETAPIAARTGPADG
jgi:hypothetical protein